MHICHGGQAANSVQTQSEKQRGGRRDQFDRRPAEKHFSGSFDSAHGSREGGCKTCSSTVVLQSRRKLASLCYSPSPLLLDKAKALAAGTGLGFLHIGRGEMYICHGVNSAVAREEARSQRLFRHDPLSPPDIESAENACFRRTSSLQHTFYHDMRQFLTHSNRVSILINKVSFFIDFQ